MPAQSSYYIITSTQTGCTIANNLSNYASQLNFAFKSNQVFVRTMSVTMNVSGNVATVSPIVPTYVSQAADQLVVIASYWTVMKSPELAPDGIVSVLYLEDFVPTGTYDAFHMKITYSTPVFDFFLLANENGHFFPTNLTEGSGYVLARWDSFSVTNGLVYAYSLSRRTALIDFVPPRV